MRGCSSRGPHPASATHGVALRESCIASAAVCAAAEPQPVDPRHAWMLFAGPTPRVSHAWRGSTGIPRRVSLCVPRPEAQRVDPRHAWMLFARTTPRVSHAWRGSTGIPHRVSHCVPRQGATQPVDPRHAWMLFARTTPRVSHAWRGSTGILHRLSLCVPRRGPHRVDPRHAWMLFARTTPRVSHAWRGSTGILHRVSRCVSRRGDPTRRSTPCVDALRADHTARQPRMAWLYGNPESRQPLCEPPRGPNP
jgi:hypothetical protein